MRVDFRRQLALCGFAHILDQLSDLAKSDDIQWQQSSQRNFEEIINHKRSILSTKIRTQKYPFNYGW